jgi:small-conductance mechanosensitive channel
MTAIKAFLQDPFELAIPLAWLIGTLLAGLIVRKLLFRVVREWGAHSKGHLDVLITESLPLILWSLMLGVHLATQHSEIPRQYLRYVPTTIEVLWILSLTFAMSRLAGNTVRFYGARVTGVQDVTSLTQKLVQVTVAALGITWLLKVVFDLSLTPILTTLGVGGLAVALALQDTLSNLFAGFYVSISGLIHIGDYIKLNTGEEGYVTDINWRCTTMRSHYNNLVVIPNNKLGQAIFTNYHLPDPRMMMSITFGVGSESDVDRVEAILLDEATSATNQIKGLLADPPPYVRFTPGPGDWSMVFKVSYNIAEYADQYLVESELRKVIFKRLRKEGVSMPFPTQTVLLPQMEQKSQP